MQEHHVVHYLWIVHFLWSMRFKISQVIKKKFDSHINLKIDTGTLYCITLWRGVSCHAEHLQQQQLVVPVSQALTSRRRHVRAARVKSHCTRHWCQSVIPYSGRVPCLSMWSSILLAPIYFYSRNSLRQYSKTVCSSYNKQFSLHF
jgi:hypothetical protein